MSEKEIAQIKIISFCQYAQCQAELFESFPDEIQKVLDDERKKAMIRLIGRGCVRGQVVSPLSGGNQVFGAPLGCQIQY